MREHSPRIVLPTLTFCLLTLLGAGNLLAAGGSSAPSPPPSLPKVERTPEQLADEAYNGGLKHRDKAWKMEERAEKAADRDRAKLEGKIREQYEKAAKRYREAIAKNPGHYQAHSSLGYALRKLGDYEAALSSYDKALKLAPMYAEALEYRGEAYLGLNRLDDAKKAYMQLFELDRARADELMRAMEAWLESRRQDSQGVAADAIDGFAKWLAERSELAEQTTALYQRQAKAW